MASVKVSKKWEEAEVTLAVVLTIRVLTVTAKAITAKAIAVTQVGPAAAEKTLAAHMMIGVFVPWHVR